MAGIVVGQSEVCLQSTATVYFCKYMITHPVPILCEGFCHHDVTDSNRKRYTKGGIVCDALGRGIAIKYARITV